MTAITSMRPVSPMIPSTGPSFEPVRSRSLPSNRSEAIDTFVRTGSDPWTNTPITDAFVDNINAPSTPTSKKITLALLTPIMVPLTVALDVVLWPLFKVQQVTNWVKSKFA